MKKAAMTRNTGRRGSHKRSKRGETRADDGRLWTALLLVLLTTGCGNAIYLTHVSSAEERFQEASDLDADEKATYEYYAAKARLEQAKRFAAQAEYGYAIRLAKESEQYSRAAVNQVRNGPAHKPTRSTGSRTKARADGDGAPSTTGDGAERAPVRVVPPPADGSEPPRRSEP